VGRLCGIPTRTVQFAASEAVEHIATGGYKLIKHQSEGDNYT